MAPTDPASALARALAFVDVMTARRSVRAFARTPIPDGVLEACVAAAGRSPSGANRQPWHFVVVRSERTKERIRAEAEAVERRFYEDRHQAEWHAALEDLGTTWRKPFLSDAPALIVVFARAYDVEPSGERVRNYYVRESVGIATGILVTALHTAGLGTLTYTPNPNGFLSTVLGRPGNERPFMIVVAGYPAAPELPSPGAAKKPLDQIMTVV